MKMHELIRLVLACLIVGALGVAAAAAQEDIPLPASEGQAFLGYWLVSANLGGNDVKMGLTVEAIASAQDTVLKAAMVGFFGEVEATKMHRDGEALVFDLATGFGTFTTELRLEGEEIRGRLVQADGTEVAGFTAVESDRTTLARFLVPDNETRIVRGDQLVRVRFGQAKLDGRDYPKVGELGAGEVLGFEEHEAIKLTTEMPLRFGDLEIPTENVAEDYPGVYSLWLKRTQDGWQLVFNNKPDVWGTQYDSEADHGAVPLQYAAAAEPSDTLGASLEDGDSGSKLTIVWGEHSWSTSLDIVAPEAQ